uniref:EF-hand domain-containing protein n=1 Tax=Romanomermis culicivorax TaxID=13658 RepID=A0A915JAN4_ROMCU
MSRGLKFDWRRLPRQPCREVFSYYTYFTLETGAIDLEGSLFNVYRPETLQQLCKLTKFSKKELQIMYRGFKEGCTSGLLTLEQFKDIYARFFPQGGDVDVLMNSSHYATFIFNTFDTDSNGQISFDEFVLGLSVLSRGSEDEKLRWVFNLYDLDHDGYLSRHDIETVLSSIYDMMGPHTNPPVEEHTIRQHADDIFGRMDKNCDGLITFREFLISCKKDVDIIQSLHLFDTVFSTGANPSRSNLSKISC